MSAPARKPSGTLLRLVHSDQAEALRRLAQAAEDRAGTGRTWTSEEVQAVALWVRHVLSRATTHDPA